MTDYRKLDVFALAHELAVEVFRVTEKLPRGKRGELGDQLRRASMSIPANIVEGCGRDSDPDMLRHFRIALGSAGEVEYFLVYARDTGLLASAVTDPLIAKAASVRRMIAGFIKGIQGNRRPAAGSGGASELLAEARRPTAEALARR